MPKADFLSRTVAYKPRPVKLVRVPMNRKLSPQEADIVLSTLPEACLCQREDKTTVMVPAKHRPLVEALAAQMELVHV